LKQLVEKQPAAEVDEELLKVEAVEGLSSFLRLQRVRRWADQDRVQKEALKNVEAVINRLTTSLEKRLSDPERIVKFIKNLNAETVEERAYALAQLKR